MGKCLAKRVAVDAVQWTGSNIEEMRRLLPEHQVAEGFAYEPGKPLLSRGSPDGTTYHEIAVGEWVVRGPDGYVFDIPRDRFDVYFEGEVRASKPTRPRGGGLTSHGG
jgi:hypothetical protein